MVQVSCVYAFHLHLEDGHECRAHRHACTEIVWCDGCTGILTQGDARQRYHADSIFVYQPGNDHWIHNDRAGEQICIGVHGCKAEQLPSGIYKRDSDIDSLFALCRQAIDAQQQLQLDCIAGLIALHLHGDREEDNSVTAQARQFIEAHLSERLNAKSIAEHVYVSPGYLRQLFKEESGDSLMHYVIKRRIELATALLSDSTMSIAEIAGHCGFQSPYYFSRMYKKYTGKSPSTSRKLKG